MSRTISSSASVREAIRVTESLQKRFVLELERVANSLGETRNFAPVEWLRDEGKHGGGIRREAPQAKVFNTGSVNFSHVHYDDEPSRALRSATALSTIIHPQIPFSPSVHMHVSWTEMKNGKGYWRIMADLNPAIANDNFKSQFLAVIGRCAKPMLNEGLTQGDLYFFIPGLNRHRGVAHFYLEEFNSGDQLKDAAYAEELIGSTMDQYAKFITAAENQHPNPSPADFAAQLEYHSVYFFQVLIFDRGTTAGLLVHDQNDVGTLGSLPAHVDHYLLRTWIEKLREPQSELLKMLLEVFPSNKKIVDVGVAEKKLLAQVIRAFYAKFPSALDLQAKGNLIPKTMANHRNDLLN